MRHSAPFGPGGTAKRGIHMNRKRQNKPAAVSCYPLYHTKESTMIGKNFPAIAVMFVVTFFFVFPKTDARAAGCDRQCLRGFVTKYLDALTAKKTDSLPLAANVKFTENCKQLNVGEGYWKDVNGTVRYRLDVIDVNQSGAGALVVIKGSASVLLALRLKIANQKISEIETIVTKSSSEGMIFIPDGFKVPPADSDMTLMPKTELLNTRAEMIALASKYPEAMRKGSGTFNKNGLYFSKGAYRLENGQRMAGPGCVMGSGCENIGTQGLPNLSGMVYKPALVDEQAGIVMLRMNFGKGSVMSGSGTLDVFEAFKIFNDSMRCVYAIMRVVPEGTGFGWDYTITGVQNNLPQPAAARNALNTANGIVVPLEFPCEKIALYIYNTSGRLVTARSVATIPTTSTLFVPMDLHALSQGRFFGRIVYENGGALRNSLMFKVNTVR